MNWSSLPPLLFLSPPVTCPKREDIRDIVVFIGHSSGISSPVRFLVETELCPWGFLPCGATHLILVGCTDNCVTPPIIPIYDVVPQIQMIPHGDAITYYNYPWMVPK